MRDMHAANILPDVLTRREEGAPIKFPVGGGWPFLFSDLNAAACGYDFLLQAANAVSAEAAFHSLDLNWISGRIDKQAVAALQGAKEPPLSTALLSSLASDASVGENADIVILFSRKDILFDSQTTCRVRANVRVAIGKFFKVPKVPPIVGDPLPGETVQRFGSEVARIVENALREITENSFGAELRQISPKQVLRTENLQRPRETGRTLSGSVAGERQLFEQPKRVDLGNQQWFDVTAWLGYGVLEIPATFGATSNRASATIRVSADVGSASPRYTGLSHDTELLLGASDPIGLVAETTYRVRERREIALLNEISLVGGPSTARVNNLSQLSPEAFPCGTGACPLCIGATIVAWHVGAPSSVRLVGESGYAVLWSSEAVQLLVKYCWEYNYFPRTIVQSIPVKLTIDGKIQDATAESDIKLETLDAVSLDYDSNSRTDVLHMGGAAQVVPRSFRLADGRVLLPSDPSDALFAPGPIRSWNAVGTLTEGQLTGSSSDIIEFERRVTNGVTSRLGRPFTEPGGSVLYSRISAFSQRILLVVE